MESAAIRVFTFSILPVVLAGGHLALDRRSRSPERAIEIVLLYLFGIGVAAGGIGGFFGHLFVSDMVAESIGWPSGNPFQLEVGVANLAVGILGLIAMGRRDGFREATVVAVTVLGVGATIVHVADLIESGNLAPGNTIQNISNLLKPALLTTFLVAARRAELSPDSEQQTAGFERWRGSRIQVATLMTVGVATGFGVGLALALPVVGTLVGILVGALLSAHVLRQHVTPLTDAHTPRELVSKGQRHT